MYTWEYTFYLYSWYPLSFCILILKPVSFHREISAHTHTHTHTYYTCIVYTQIHSYYVLYIICYILNVYIYIYGILYYSAIYIPISSILYIYIQSGIALAFIIILFIVLISEWWNIIKRKFLRSMIYSIVGRRTTWAKVLHSVKKKIEQESVQSEVFVCPIHHMYADTEYK